MYTYRTPEAVRPSDHGSGGANSKTLANSAAAGITVPLAQLVVEMKNRGSIHPIPSSAYPTATCFRRGTQDYLDPARSGEYYPEIRAPTETSRGTIHLRHNFSGVVHTPSASFVSLRATTCELGHRFTASDRFPRACVMQHT